MKNKKSVVIATIVILLAGMVNRLPAQGYPFELPKLPYGYNALEPVIDAQTMEIHYAKHHANYVKNLNNALKGTEIEKIPLEGLLLYAGEYGDPIRNNAGGHYNHSLYWNTLGLNSPFDAQNAVGKAVMATFGTPDSLKKLLNKAGATRFGSGWAWLYVTPEKKLAVCSSPNQDNPIMDVSPERGIPILAIDVWEHAYYLKYQNKRGDYLSAVTGAINWEAVNKNYTDALANPLLKRIEKDGWTELNDFHDIISQTFHPSEEGNLKPVRGRSGELLSKAKALKGGRFPASFNTPEIKKTIDDLVKGAASVNQMVIKKAGDKTITKKLDEVHNLYHAILALCEH